MLFRSGSGYCDSDGKFCPSSATLVLAAANAGFSGICQPAPVVANIPAQAISSVVLANNCPIGTTLISIGSVSWCLSTFAKAGNQVLTHVSTMITQGDGSSRCPAGTSWFPLGFTPNGQPSLCLTYQSAAAATQFVTHFYIASGGAACVNGDVLFGHVQLGNYDCNACGRLALK